MVRGGVVTQIVCDHRVTAMPGRSDLARRVLVRMKPFAFAVGDRCGYRQKGADPLVEVELLKIGQEQKNPRTRRVFIRWVDDEFEGREQWVPAIRLKVPWADAVELMEKERRWAGIRYGVRGTTEAWAVALASMTLPKLEDLVERQNNDDEGAAIIDDVDGLAEFLGVDASFFDADENFVEGGRLVVAWPVTKRIVRRAVERDPYPILHYLDAEDSQRLNETEHYGVITYDEEERRYVRRLPGVQMTEHIRQSHAILREWCGAEPNRRESEIQALRSEIYRLGLLLEGAIKELRRARRPTTADRLERSLTQKPEAGDDGTARPSGASNTV